jgi:cell division protein FtsL
MLLLNRTMTIRKESEFSATSLWTWFLRIMMGVVSFLLISLYQDLKSLMTEIQEIRVMLAEQGKDIQYLKEGYNDFKQETRVKLTKMEEKK